MGLFSAANFGNTVGGIGSLVSSVGGLFGGGNDAEGNMRDQLQFQKEQFKLQKDLAYSGKQILANDLEKAGLNRILAMNPSAGSPSASPVGNVPVDTPSAQSQASTARKLMYAQVSNIMADTAKKFAERDTIKKQGDLADANTRGVNATTNIKSPAAEVGSFITDLFGGVGAGSSAAQKARDSIPITKDKMVQKWKDAVKKQKAKISEKQKAKKSAWEKKREYRSKNPSVFDWKNW
jgi:hypothetical protein